MEVQARRWRIRMYLAVILGCLLVLLGAWGIRAYRQYAVRQATSEVPGPDELADVLRRQAGLATTSVSLTKLGIYDSDKSDAPCSLWKPSTIKFGRRACVVPVHITIHYGIDLTTLSPGDITVDGRMATVRLPQPTIVSKEMMAQTPADEVFSLATGLRAVVGHSEINHIKDMAYQAALRDTRLHEELAAEIRNNTAIVCGSLLRSLGFEADIQFKK